MLGWHDLTELKLPLWKVGAWSLVLIGAVWGAFTWADDIEDKQMATQDQLSQLVLIVTKTTTDTNAKNDIQDEDIDAIEDAFDLLRQEIELRRELDDD
jgi:hypothetical protein